jgi:hypothetical protein
MVGVLQNPKPQTEQRTANSHPNTTSPTMTAEITTTAQPHRRHNIDVKLNQVVHSVLDAHLTLRWWMILSY